jgi:histidinol phosphatase-like PHP family hydrolase
VDESDERIKRGAAMLKKHGVAAEINYHTNEPEPEFFRLCIEQGVKIVFGSDSHNLCEIGDFYPHLRLIDRIGCRDRLPSLFPVLPE